MIGIIHTLLLTSVLLFSSCQEQLKVEETLPEASSVCYGTSLYGVEGIANCTGIITGNSYSEDDPLPILTYASRIDNASFPVTGGDFATFFTAPDRTVATLNDEVENNSTFTSNHSVIPYPLSDTDGRYAPCLVTPGLACDTSDIPDYPAKKHYLETIAAYDPTIASRANLVVCGTAGDIDTRIADCLTKNGLWAYYDGRKYGQDGEGDWRMISVFDDGVTTYEIWRDERTKLLWSDKSDSAYNWYQAAGYSKSTAVSTLETQFTSQPGVLENSDPLFINQTLQPANPISVCPDVTAGGAIAAGGGTYSTYDTSTETKFKANLAFPDVTWRLPSKYDWLLAEVNGIRKVLPNMYSNFWAATSVSDFRRSVWYFDGINGTAKSGLRNNSAFVRCVSHSTGL